MGSLDVFLDKLGPTISPLSKLQAVVKYKIINTFKSQSVHEIYGKWRTGLCEWCEKNLSEEGYSRHEYKGIGHGYFLLIFKEEREDQLLAMIEPISTLHSITTTLQPPNLTLPNLSKELNIIVFNNQNSPIPTVSCTMTTHPKNPNLTSLTPSQTRHSNTQPIKSPNLKKFKNNQNHLKKKC